MRSLLLCACFLFLIGPGAYGQSYTMKVHLKTGGTVTIPIDEVQRVSFSQTTAVADPTLTDYTPTAFHVLQNYPNPFNPVTTIVYEITGTSDVTVRVYDVRGSLIKDLLHESQQAGRHVVSWDGTDNARSHVSSGVYITVVQCAGQVLSRKMILMK
jgi:hypothetical protein